jgi:hypothetical protein
MPTPPVGPPALTEVAPSASPAAAPAPFSARPIAAGDYPGCSGWWKRGAPTAPPGAGGLAEARRLEQIVRAKYLEQNDAARVRWAQRETEPALEAARALESAYRGTALERSAADLVRWFEANRTAASR